MNHAVIELTNHCNFKCKMCEAKNHRNNEVLQISEVKRIIDELWDARNRGGALSDVWMISFHGMGEPLLYPDLVEAIRYAKKKFNVGFVTNGFLLSESIAYELLNAGLDWICFSLNGIETDIYKQFQGYDLGDDKYVNHVMNHVISNIKMLAIMADKYNKRTEIRISYILNEDSKSHLPEFIRYWKSTGLEIMIQVLRYQAWKKVKTAKYTRCEMFNNNFIIHGNGEIYACGCDQSIGKDMKLGSIYEDRLYDAFNGMKYKGLQNVHMEVDLDHMPDSCKKCNNLRNFGFMRNNNTTIKVIYTNSIKKTLIWNILIRGYNLLAELKKYKVTYPIWEAVNNIFRKKVLKYS